MKKLKILVFDDSEINQTSAKLTLAGHDLTVVGTYDQAQDALIPKTGLPDFDVVLTDLLVPASARNLNSLGEKLVGQEMPLGAVIALLALTRGVKKVAVVTDLGHHDHPASAAVDSFGDCFGAAKCGEEIRILCTNKVRHIQVDVETNKPVGLEFLDSDAGREKYPSEGWRQRKGLTGGGKDWRQILKRLLFGDDDVYIDDDGDFEN